jgi:thiamine transport system substrate-binding protein
VNRSRVVIGCVVLVGALVVSACGSSGGPSTASTSPSKPPSKNVVLMTHDSFAVSAAVLAEFTRETGYTVKVLKSGDAGKALSEALLVKDHPVADAMFGVDNTFLSRALDNGLFDAYSAKGIGSIPEEFRLDPKNRVTPIDHGDVCVNDDLAWFGQNGHPPKPTSLADLAKPAYRKLLVVENPASSSPGLAFVLASIASFGENGWHDYWSRLRTNGVRVDDGWEQAYDTDFTAGGGSGDRPLVVSYATDPAADVVFSNGKKKTPTVGVVPGTCFGQVEFAGVLANAKNPVGARALIDFMLTRRFQEDVPLQMYVYPVVPTAKLPPVFTKFAVAPADPLTVSAANIGKHRNEWIDEWTRIVLQ